MRRIAFQKLLLKLCCYIVSQSDYACQNHMAILFIAIISGVSFMWQNNQRHLLARLIQMILDPQLWKFCSAVVSSCRLKIIYNIWKTEIIIKCKPGKLFLLFVDVALFCRFCYCCCSYCCWLVGALLHRSLLSTVHLETACSVRLLVVINLFNFDYKNTDIYHVSQKFNTWASNIEYLV